MKDLTSRVLDAIRIMKSEGIEGWGIDCPSELDHLFESHELETVGCSDSRCGHHSHDGAAPVVKLIPVEGVDLTKLGWDEDCTYFHVHSHSKEWYLRLHDGGHFHSSLRVVDPSIIPIGVFGRIAGSVLPSEERW